MQILSISPSQKFRYKSLEVKSNLLKSNLPTRRTFLSIIGKQGQSLAEIAEAQKSISANCLDR